MKRIVFEFSESGYPCHLLSLKITESEDGYSLEMIQSPDDGPLTDNEPLTTSLSEDEVESILRIFKNLKWKHVYQDLGILDGLNWVLLINGKKYEGYENFPKSYKSKKKALLSTIQKILQDNSINFVSK